MASTPNVPAEIVTCPYWLVSIKSCLICKKGLFLPVSEYISIYCRTENYSLCPRYEQYGADRIEYKTGSGKVADRRKSARIFSSFSLRYTGLERDSTHTALLERQATTVDLSFGGLRFQGPHEPPVGSMVSFFLNDYPGSPVRGVGQVKWSRPLNDSTGFDAGMTFTEGSTSGSVRRLIDGVIRKSLPTE